MIKIKDVWYRAGGNQILSEINLQVALGEFVSLVGPSGAGKSTLLRLIHMAILPTKGVVVVDNYNSRRITKNEIPLLRRKVGFIFQDFKLLEDRDVFENVAFALWATGARPKTIKKLVFQVLARVGLSHKRYSEIDKLSGGEKQRVAIARALVNEPFVLLADEPTGNLDPDTTEDILTLLRRINSRGTAVLMATHKENLVHTLPSKLVKLIDGRIKV